MRKSDAELLRLFNYDPLTGKFSRKEEYRGNAKHKIGSLCKGYVIIKIDGHGYAAHRLAWLYVHGHSPVGVIDHINGDKADNRIANLRDTTHQVNAQNISVTNPKSRSGLRGAYWASSIGRWMSLITVDWKRIYLGNFQTAEDAHQAYLQAKAIHHPLAFKSQHLTPDPALILAKEVA